MTASAAAEPPRALSRLRLPENIKLHHVLLVALVIFACFTRFWRLDVPSRCYFDEVYFPTNGALILRGDNSAWDFYGTENTHPPLSKVFMAAGEGIFGHKSYEAGATNDCWGDREDAPKRTNPAWLYDPFGWRFFGALAGVGSVIFMYLLARRLFHSEVAGLAAGFLLSIDGLALTQSRIATPDTYVLFFMLGAVYFLVSYRWLLSGLFLGATAASKWIGALTIIPVVLWFAWSTFVRWREAGPDPRLREAERVLLVGVGAGLGGALIGVALAIIRRILDYDMIAKPVLLAAGLPVLLGVFIITGGLVAILTDRELRKVPRGRVYLQAALSFPLFFLAVPFAVYMASYTPMAFNGYGTPGEFLDHWWYLNRLSWEFHSSLEATHPYQSAWWEWPIDLRPVFLYLGHGYTKIYNLGNPMVFWMALPALTFTAWQGLRFVRVQVQSGAHLALWGRIGHQQAVLLFVVLSYLGFWLPWAANPRALFLYHYLPALAFAILALSYVIHWLWNHPSAYGRQVAVLYLGVAFVTFVYFYPHWAAVDIRFWLDETYYWFKSWR